MLSRTYFLCYYQYFGLCYYNWQRLSEIIVGIYLGIAEKLGHGGAGRRRREEWMRLRRTLDNPAPYFVCFCSIASSAEILRLGEQDWGSWLNWISSIRHRSHDFCYLPNDPRVFGISGGVLLLSFNPLKSNVPIIIDLVAPQKLYILLYIYIYFHFFNSFLFIYQKKHQVKIIINFEIMG